MAEILRSYTLYVALYLGVALTGGLWSTLRSTRCATC